MIGGEEAARLRAAAPAHVPSLLVPAGALARAAVGGTAGALAQGEQADVHLPVGSRDVVVRIRRRDVVTGVDSELGAVANTVATPGLVRRERIGPDGVTWETVLVASTLPLVWLQWEAQAGGLGPIRVHLAPATVPHSPGGDGERCILFDVGSGGTLVAAIVGPAGLALEEEAGGPPRLVIDPHPEARDPITLVLAGGRDAGLRSSLAAAAHAGAHARRASEGPEDGVVVSTGVPEIDEGFSWARVRAASLSAALRPEKADAAAAIGLAAVAVGDRASAHRALARLAPGSSAHALLAARIAAVLGETGPAASAVEPFLELRDDSTPELRPRAAQALADALRYAAPPERIRAVRGAGARPGAQGGRLPMAGPKAALLDADAQWLRWRSALASGLENGPAGIATWDDPDAPGDAPRTAEVLSTLVERILGIVPDAPSGRIEIAPALPAHVRRFRVSGVPLGESRLELRYERRDGVHRFVVSPERASVPPLLILTPEVDGAVRSVRMDGAEADLDVRSAGGKTRVPVQLPLDGDRVVEIAATE